MVATLRRSAKKVHEDKTKPRTPVTPAHNDGPSDDVILVFAGELISVRADKAALNKVEKKIKQRMTNAGITVAEMDEAIKLTEIGPDAVAERFKKLLRYSRVLGAPIGTQLSFFTDPDQKAPAYEDELKKAYDWGRTLSLLGKGPDEQMYPPNTPLGQEHLKGWNDGQKVRHEQLMRNSEEEAARVKKLDEEKKAKAAAKDAKKLRAGKFTPTVVPKDGEAADEPTEEKTDDDEVV